MLCKKWSTNLHFFFQKTPANYHHTFCYILTSEYDDLVQKCSQSRFCVFAKDLPHKNVDNAIKMPEIEFIERLLMLFCFYVFLYPSMQQSFFAFLIGNCISIVRNFIFSGVRVTNPLHFKCFYCIQN